MARQGSKQSAQEMLSQLRELLDRLQSGRMARRQGQGQGQQSQQMMRMMDKFGEIIGKQQRLMDDTFGAQRQGRQGQRGQQGQQGQQGQGQQGQGRQGQGQGQLGQRQGELEGQLGGLQRDLRRFGLRPPGQLDGARRSMENARRALERGDLSRATREQSRALEQLRQGTQSMAQQLRNRMPGQFGRAEDAPLDPLGRPQRTEGPDLGTSVKVPDEIDAARVREILRELRKRLGERYRPELEREYIERLLERF